MVILRRLILLIVGSATLFWLIAAYFAAYPEWHKTEQIRYRITAAIDTPLGVRTGSGVWGYRLAPHFLILDFQWYYFGRVEGEAIPIDLGDGRTVYVVLGGREMPRDLGAGMEAAWFNYGFMNDMPLYRLTDPPIFSNVGDVGSESFARAWIAAAKAKVAPVSLDCVPILHQRPSSECPAVVMVRDAAGHKIDMLDPLDYEKTLGSGFRLRGMTLAVVPDPVTHGIVRRLPWVRPATDGDMTYATEPLRALGFSRADEP